MADVFTPEKRSEVMSRIRSKWTRPERIMHNHLKGRKIKHKMHPNIPGSPDIILPERGRAVFIHGCFWHGCPKCYREPKSRREYWIPKVRNNIKRDAKNARALRRGGWSVVRLWEHDVVKRTGWAVSRAVK